MVADGAPVGCLTPTAAFDTDRSKLVVVCADAATVYEWDGAAWKGFTATNTKNVPPFHRFASMAYDATLKKTVLFGGFDGTNYIESDLAVGRRGVDAGEKESADRPHPRVNVVRPGAQEDRHLRRPRAPDDHRSRHAVQRHVDLRWQWLVAAQSVRRYARHAVRRADDHRSAFESRSALRRFNDSPCPRPPGRPPPPGRGGRP